MEIKQLLLERNQQHFGQADGTPFTRPPLNFDVQYDGSGLHAKTIVKGQYDTSQMTEATSLCIEHLQRKSMQELDGNITEDNKLGKRRRWPERTTTSPSGLHLGHYHAME